MPKPNPEAADVLVVEDDAQLNELVGAYVEIAGFTYRSALEGETALREVDRSRPALIILDIMLPDIDGFEVCRRLKANQSSASVPIVMLTAMTEDHSRQRAMECGATGYMTKPFDPEVLMATIRDKARNGHSK